MKLFGPNCATVSFMASTNPGSEIPYLSRLKQSKDTLQFKLICTAVN